MSAPTRRRPPDDRAKDDAAESAVRDGTAGPGPIPAAPVLATPKRRPRRMLMAAGAILVILCALGTYWLTQRSAERVAVVGVAHDVSWGEVVTSADLVQVEVVNDPALKPVLWADVSSLVGQYAAADLQAGSLLTTRSVTGAEVPGPGKALVGVSVKQAQMPVTTLHPGDRVVLVATADTPTAQQPTGNASAGSGPVDATVFAVGSTDPSGARTVDVILAEDLAAKVASASAAGKVAIVLVPRS
jgi:hypothetical protein